jgi:hypothetical protein
MLKTLISEDDKAEVINLYVDFFSAPAVEDSVPLDDQHATLGIQFGDKDGGHTDLGVEFEANLPPDILASNLGFSKNLPLLFNEYRHKAGFTPWQSEHETLFNPELAAKNPAMDPLILYWHQIAGLHSIIRSNFSSEPVRDTTLGCLVADEVGLGKTFLSAMVIAFLSDVVTRQSMMKGSIGDSVKLPPLLSKSNSTFSLTEANSLYQRRNRSSASTKSYRNVRILFSSLERYSLNGNTGLRLCSSRGLSTSSSTRLAKPNERNSGPQMDRFTAPFLEQILSS